MASEPFKYFASLDISKSWSLLPIPASLNAGLDYVAVPALSCKDEPYHQSYDE